MSKFIELTVIDLDLKLYLDASRIVFIGKYSNGDNYIRISTGEKDMTLVVKETPAEIMAKIQEVQNG